MSQITLKNTIDELISFGTGHTVVNTTNFGDMDKVFSSSISYPYLRINYRGTEIEEKRVNYNFQIVCADKKLHDDSDLIDKYSLTEGILQQLTTYIKYGSRFKNIWRIEYPIKIYAASSQFIDGACANVLDLTLSVHNALCLSSVQLNGGAS